MAASLDVSDQTQPNSPDLDVPAWVHRWKTKQVSRGAAKLSEARAWARTLSSENANPQQSSSDTAPTTSEAAATHDRGGAPSRANGTAPTSASADVAPTQEEGGAHDNTEAGRGIRSLRLELANERANRQAAEELSQLYSAQADDLREEVTRLHAILRRIDVNATETAEEAMELAEMFTNMAAQARALATVRGGAVGRDQPQPPREEGPCTTLALPPSVLAERLAERRQQEQEKEEADFREMQFNFMAMQYDDVFSNLEERQNDTTLLLTRASYLRQRAKEMEDADELLLLPERGTPLPPGATVSASELKTIFAKAEGPGGYRKVELPFLTICQIWRCAEHPDPDEDVLQGVISYLQQRWEEVRATCHTYTCFKCTCTHSPACRCGGRRHSTSTCHARPSATPTHSPRSPIRSAHA